MYSREELLGFFKKTGVLQEGHFVLSSGRHANKYLQCAKILQYPKYTQKLSSDIAEKWKDKNIELVVGPAIGGIVLSYAVAQALSTRSIFTERKNAKMMLRRSFNIKAREKVLVVEDVVTTGGSVKEVIDLLEDKDADIIGISSIVNRGDNVDFHYPFRPLLDLYIPTYLPEKCPMCKKGEKIIKPGSREG